MSTNKAAETLLVAWKAVLRYFCSYDYNFLFVNVKSAVDWRLQEALSVVPPRISCLPDELVVRISYARAGEILLSYP
jgi:hypothetical protein